MNCTAFQAVPHEPVVAQAEKPRRFACQEITTAQTFMQLSKSPAMRPWRLDASQDATGSLDKPLAKASASAEEAGHLRLRDSNAQMQVKINARLADDARREAGPLACAVEIWRSASAVRCRGKWREEVAGWGRGNRRGHGTHGPAGVKTEPPMRHRGCGGQGVRGSIDAVRFNRSPTWPWRVGLPQRPARARWHRTCPRLCEHVCETPCRPQRKRRSRSVA